MKQGKFSKEDAKKKIIQNYQFTYIGIVPVINDKNVVVDLLCSLNL